MNQIIITESDAVESATAKVLFEDLILNLSHKGRENRHFDSKGFRCSRDCTCLTDYRNEMQTFPDYHNETQTEVYHVRMGSSGCSIVWATPRVMHTMKQKITILKRVLSVA